MKPNNFVVPKIRMATPEEVKQYLLIQHLLPNPFEEFLKATKSAAEPNARVK